MGVRSLTPRCETGTSPFSPRMRTGDMLPIAEEMDAAGFHSVEVWGGATFDTALRFLREDHGSACAIKKR